MTDRPTDDARANFGYVQHYAALAQRHFASLKFDKTTNKIAEPTDEQLGNMEMASAIMSLGFGLRHLSTGLRATYMLLEEVNRKLPK